MDRIIFALSKSVVIISTARVSEIQTWDANKLGAAGGSDPEALMMRRMS